MKSTRRVGRAHLVTLPPEIIEGLGIERGDLVEIDVIKIERVAKRGSN